MKKIDRMIVYGVFFCAAFFGILLFYALFVTRIPPGNVGVVVNMLGDDRGVEAHELHVGLHVIAPWKDVYEFPTFEQNHAWDNFVLQTQEGLVVTASVGITFNLRPDYIPILFQKYRRGMNEITDIFVRNHIRDAINRQGAHYKVEELYGASKDAFLDEVLKIVSGELSNLGINISRIYLIGRLHFPDNVVAALNSKIEATQRAQQRENELREAEAQARKEVAKAEDAAKCLILQAEAEAKANYVLAQSVSAELVRWQAVQKWDGKMPHTMAGSELPFMLQIKE